MKFIGILFILPLCIARSKYVVMDDMEMSKETYDQFFSAGRTKRASINTRGSFKIWDVNMTDGNWIIPYAMKRGMVERIRVKILDAIKDFEAMMCVKFVEATTEEEFLIFTTDEGCSSGVGRDGPRQVSISEGPCERKGTIQHEIMHAFGFFHEHQRPDRDEYIKLHQENIRSGIEINFMKMTRFEVDSNGIDYDYSSVMQYSSTAGNNKYGAFTITKLNGSKITEYQRDFMSEGDIKQLNLLYRCPDLTCSDSINTTHCKRKVRKGFCHKVSSKMYKKCRKSCGFCDCKDQNDCSGRSKTECFDPETREKMRVDCPIMCGYCGKACLDASKSNCAKKARKRGCETNEYRMALTCPKTCGYCVSVD